MPEATSLASTTRPPLLAKLLFVLRALLFAMLTVATCSGLIICQFPALLVWPFSAPLYRAWIRKTERIFGSLVVVLLWTFVPSSMILYQDYAALEGERNVVVMSNHQIYPDWLYHWMFARLYQMHGDVLIILMDVLKWLPLLGIGMWFFEFIFVKRNWKQDQITLQRGLRRAVDRQHPVWMLIFPEGTLNTRGNREASRTYAKTKELPEVPDIVLLPKSTGLFHSIEVLRPSAVFDVTVGYPGSKHDEDPYETFLFEKCFFEGKFPPQIHFHVQRVAVDTIPGFRPQDLEVQDVKKPPGEEKENVHVDRPSASATSRRRATKTMDNLSIPAPGTSNPPPANGELKEREALFNQWLRTRFMQKDALMHQFYASPSFPSTTRIQSVAIRPTLQDWASVLLAWVVMLTAWELGYRAILSFLFQT